MISIREIVRSACSREDRVALVFGDQLAGDLGPLAQCPVMKNAALRIAAPDVSDAALDLCLRGRSLAPAASANHSSPRAITRSTRSWRCDRGDLSAAFFITGHCGRAAPEIAAASWSPKTSATRSRAAGDRNFPIEINAPENRAPAAAGIFGAGASRLPARDLVLFTRQLATLIGRRGAARPRLGLIAPDHRDSGAPASVRTAGSGQPRRKPARGPVATIRHCPPIPDDESLPAKARGDIGDAARTPCDRARTQPATSRALLGALIYPASVSGVACLSVSFLLALSCRASRNCWQAAAERLSQCRSC